MSERAVVLTGLAAVIGLVSWIATMATAPRYSSDPENMGHPGAYIVVVVIACFIGGIVLSDERRYLPHALVLPAVMLAPWTAPRGDDDGLWALIFIVLGMIAMLLVGVGWLGAQVRTRSTGITSRRHHPDVSR